MTNSASFKVIYLAGMISVFVVRLTYRIRSRSKWVAEGRFRNLEMLLMMLDHFGYEYQDYMNRTGRVLPRWP